MGKRRTTKLRGGRHGIPPDEVARIQRERLLAAMAAVAAEVGYPNTTVRRLLARAGISRLTFYELFRDKEDCFLAAFDEAVGRLVARVGAACEAGATPEDRLRHALSELAACCAREPELARMCIVESFAAGAAARARRGTAMARLAELIEGSVRELRPGAELPPLAPRALAGGVEELVYQAVERGETDQLPQLVDEIVAAHLSLVRAL